VDLAVVCPGLYARGALAGTLELLAQPVLPEGLVYQSVLIVPTHGATRSVAELRGRTLAHGDPESHTGCFVVRRHLSELGFPPQRFFGRIAYLGGHDRSVEAVALGQVDGAAVQSLELARLLRRRPELAGGIRELWRSPAEVPPPVVAPRQLPAAERERLRDLLLRLHELPGGAAALATLGYTRFALPDEAGYAALVRQYQDHPEWLHAAGEGQP
jgi:phosphonate transport system substrate-binding protein